MTARPSEEGTELPLIEAARAGDRGAFGRLYERYAGLVHGILLASVSRSEVEDLMQEVFLQAFRSLPALRDVAAFGGWLATIARNRARDHHRGSVPLEELPEDLAEEPRRRGESLAALEAIRSLPEAYRETLVLRLCEGMTGPEIAASTGLTPGSVRVNLHRGMKLLRMKLGAEDSRE